MAGSKQKVAVAAPTNKKPAAKKGGKRDAEVAVVKAVNAKKPKLVKEALTAKKKAEAAKMEVVEKVEISSEEVEDESESEEEAPAPAFAPEKESVPAVTAEVESSEEEGSEDDDDSEEEETATEAAAEDDVSEEEEGESDGSEEEEEDEEMSEVAAIPASNKAIADQPKTAGTQENAAATPADEEDDSEEEEGESDGSEEEEEDEEMAVAVATPASKKAKADQPKTPRTHENAGSKTLFIGNLSYSIEKKNVEEFFKEVVEPTDVRLVNALDGSFKGFGYVEFSSAEEAQKAMSLNGGELLGRPIKLDLARERTADTPNRDSSKVVAEGVSVFIRGFDKSLDEETVRSSLEEHFAECGEMTRVSIPTDRDTGSIKGIAYIDFTKADEVAKALELSGSKMGGSTLYVDCAKPKPEFGSSGGANRFGSGGGRGGFRGGRGGDRGGRRGRGGDRGGGRRGGGRGRRGGY